MVPVRCIAVFRLILWKCFNPQYLFFIVLYLIELIYPWSQITHLILTFHSLSDMTSSCIFILHSRLRADRSLRCFRSFSTQYLSLVSLISHTVLFASYTRGPNAITLLKYYKLGNLLLSVTPPKDLISAIAETSLMLLHNTKNHT